MKKYLLLLMVIAVGCNERSDTNTTTTSLNSPDSIPVADHTTVAPPADTSIQAIAPASNERFKDVTVKKISSDSVHVSGKARIFEANLSYAVYEKGKQVREGFHTASAGAPEWGDFDFNIASPRSSGDTGTYIIIFESSAKDGSRVGVLKFPL